MPATKTRVSGGFTITVGDFVRFNTCGSSGPSVGYVSRIDGDYIFVTVVRGARFYDIECLENEIQEVIHPA